jgi:hypothetical protein
MNSTEKPRLKGLRIYNLLGINVENYFYQLSNREFNKRGKIIIIGISACLFVTEEGQRTVQLLSHTMLY